MIDLMAIHTTEAKMEVTMKIIDKKISDLKPYENNPRKNDDAVESVANSIKEFGFKQPIVIDKNNVVVAGHTRLKAAESLELNTVPCIVADDLTDEQVRAYRLADNKTSDMSIWDNKKLLEELDAIGDDMFTGFEESEIFENFLDESAAGVIQADRDGDVYTLTLKSREREEIRKVKEYVMSEKLFVDIKEMGPKDE